MPEGIRPQDRVWWWYQIVRDTAGQATEAAYRVYA
jgi:hypothetical protein